MGRRSCGAAIPRRNLLHDCVMVALCASRQRPYKGPCRMGRSAGAMFQQDNRGKRSVCIDLWAAEVWFCPEGGCFWRWLRSVHWWGRGGYRSKSSHSNIRMLSHPDLAVTAGILALPATSRDGRRASHQHAAGRPRETPLRLHHAALRQPQTGLCP